MKRLGRTRVSLSLVVALSAGCLTHLPRRAAPAYREPSIALPSEPSAPGSGRVVIETDEDPATAALIVSQGVQAISTTYGTGYAVSMSTRRLCTTPCVVDLPLGEHEVLIGVEGTDHVGKIVVRAEERPSLVLATLGLRHASVGRMILGVTLVTSAAGLATYDAIVPIESPWMLGTTIAATVAGGLLWYSGRPKFRESSYAQYTLSP